MIEQFLTQPHVDYLKLINVYDKLDALVSFIATKANVLNVFVFFAFNDKLFLADIDIDCSNVDVDRLKNELKEKFGYLYNHVFINCT